MRALQGVKVSSTMTKSNPRPRKYASASDRQAAYRARAPEMCLRAESKTVDTLDRIAADLDISRADLLLSMTKFALANHDWARFGLTHKPLPFEYGIEKEKISINPLPIWARPRPKNLGKSILLTAAQKRKAKALAAAAGRKYPNLVDNIAASRNPMARKTFLMSQVGGTKVETPYDFIFTQYIPINSYGGSKVAFRFVGQNINGDVIVSEFDSGKKVGQITNYEMIKNRITSDRTAAKKLIENLLMKYGADKVYSVLTKG